MKEQEAITLLEIRECILEQMYPKDTLSMALAFGLWSLDGKAPYYETLMNEVNSLTIKFCNENNLLK